MNEISNAIPGAELIEGTLCFRGVPIHQMRAWPIPLAARIMGLGPTTLREDIRRGLLARGPHERVGADALDSYIRGEAPSKK